MLIVLTKNNRSINITGDIRAMYKAVDVENVEFVLIGTGHDLYDTEAFSKELILASGMGISAIEGRINTAVQ